MHPALSPDAFAPRRPPLRARLAPLGFGLAAPAGLGGLLYGAHRALGELPVAVVMWTAWGVALLFLAGMLLLLVWREQDQPGAVRLEDLLVIGLGLAIAGGLASIVPWLPGWLVLWLSISLAAALWKRVRDRWRQRRARLPST